MQQPFSLMRPGVIAAGLYLSGEDPRFYKRWVNQYPARLSGGSQSPTEINAQLHNAPLEHCYAC